MLCVRRCLAPQGLRIRLQVVSCNSLPGWESAQSDGQLLRVGPQRDFVIPGGLADRKPELNCPSPNVWK